jgi:hypothetical protein
MDMKQALLSTAYLAPVQYYSKFFSFDKIIIEQYENYSKQSFRNRCVIASANGPLTLSIPIERTNTPKIPIKEAKLDYQTNWQKIHFKAIESAYQNAPYYPFYVDDFLLFYTKKFTFLFDFNFAIHQVLAKNLEINLPLEFTSDYIFRAEENTMDYRECIHPKPRLTVPDADFFPAQYPQVFDLKYDFFPNLSILDLLFNTGPDAKEILLSCNISSKIQP